ncbi:MAG: hypothetical protein OQL16_05700 [Gammaproteobacteria bacterium]|nr:hypothetical protein [Gammaproteobacteria bacterium]
MSTGCQTTQARIAWDKTYGIPVNSKLTLLEPLTIPALGTQVFLQDGRQRGYNSYYPFCYFEVLDPKKTEQNIQADSFIITEVYQDETDIVQTTPTRLASLGTIVAEGTIRMIVRTTVMRLYSERQPHVKKLVCGGGFDHETFAKLPTSQEIVLTLGDIARIDTHPEHAPD